ncbi:hypothetical protein MBLNU457_5607t1 [Dothideomycetes sp. NU457]
MAHTLPLELQQHIFSYLEPQAFYASRSVSSWWNAASRNRSTLARQLCKLPIDPAVCAKTTSETQLQQLYQEAAYTSMLGLQITPCENKHKSLSQRLNAPKIAVSSNGTRAATLDSRTITLHDMTQPDAPILTTRPINDLRTAAGGGPWFKCAPTSVYELALSTNGNLLAIALERTIQIYDLADTSEDAWPVAAYIPSASGHYIAGLSFSHNDSLLRIELSNKATVVYLGTPSEEQADLAHWGSRSGLRHAFADSSKITTSVPGERVVGLQLLDKMGQGYLFAAQRHAPAGPPNSYVMGFLEVGTVHNHLPATQARAKLLVDLAISHPRKQELENTGTWNVLPSGREQHPWFASSADGSLLVFSEARVTTESTGSSNVFVYRVPSMQTLKKALDEQTAPDTVMHDSDEERMQNKHTVHRLPMHIGEIKGRVLGFDMQRLGAKECEVTITTEMGEKKWTLLDT